MIAPRVYAVRNLSSAPGTYCGLHALYAAASALERPIPLDELFEARRFRSSPDGSTVDDLNRALRTFGLAGHAVSGYRAADLVVSDRPILMLLTPDEESSAGHWVTLLGYVDGELQIFDSAAGMYSISPGAMDLYWRGTAVLVAKDTRDMNRLRLLLTFRFVSRRAAWLLASMGFVLGYRSEYFQGLQRRIRLLVIAGFALACFSVMWLFWDATLANSLKLRACLSESTRSIGSQAGVEEDHFIREIPTENALLVDCRRPGAFAQGTIPGSINIPIDASFTLWRARLERLFSNEGEEPSPRIILFCQSALCPWASIMHRRLRCLGYGSEILSGGYHRYQIEAHAKENG
ncbi:MAG: rhodanese-like domain-containing protein [Planctomycetota bacterium]